MMRRNDRTSSKVSLLSLSLLASLFGCQPPMEQPDGSSMEDGSTPAMESGTNPPPSDGGTPPGEDSSVTPPADASAGATSSSFVRVGFYDQALAVGPDERVHLAFVDGAAERVHYASCSERCGDASSWRITQLLSSTQLSTITVGPYGIGVDATGRLHMVASAVARAGQSAWELMYGTCAANCNDAPNWTFVDLSALAPGRSMIGTVNTLMVQPGGQVSFVTAGQFDGTRPAYFQCDSNCAQASQWRAVNAPINGKPLRAAMDGAGVTHVVFAGGRTMGGDQLLQYARCAGTCTNAASWQVSMLGFLYSGADFETGFGVDRSGRLFLAYNQGTISQPSPVNHRNLIASCAGADCLALDRWTSVPIGDMDEGVGGNAFASHGGGLALTSVREFELRVRTCASRCESAESWSAPTVIDTANLIASSVPADSGSDCPGRSESAAWWPSKPAIALNASGVVVVHNPSAIVKCPGVTNPMRTPTIGRVFASF